MNKHKQILDMSYMAMLIAIITIMGIVPFLGFIPLGFASVTILHIPVIIAVLYFDWKMATIAGLTFGIISWLLAVWRPTQLLDPLFVNPLLSVLPRVAFAFLTAYLFKWLSKVIKHTYTRDVVVAFVGSIIHSILVLGLIALFFYNRSDVLGTDATRKAAFNLAFFTFYTFSLLEATAAALLAPPIARALRIAKNN